MKPILILILVFSLAGCTLFEGRAGDSSKLSVDHRCDVVLQQAARAAGMDDADVIENVTVNPDCTTRVEFRQVVGDGVMGVESQGGLEVLEHGSAVQEEASDSPD